MAASTAVDIFHFAAGPDRDFKGLSEKWPKTVQSIPQRIKQNVLLFSKPSYTPPTFSSQRPVKTAASVVISDSANSATEESASQELQEAEDATPDDTPNDSSDDASSHIVPSTPLTSSEPLPPTSSADQNDTTATTPEELFDFPVSALETLHDPDLEGYLPGPLTELYNRVLAPFHPLDSSPSAIMLADFSTEAPFTYQRLAELLDNPKQHYKTLPAYLRALERVVSVVGTMSEYIEVARAEEASQKLTNGELNGDKAKDDSNMSIGLVPIPWLGPEAYPQRLNHYDNDEDDDPSHHALDDHESLDELYEKFGGEPTTTQDANTATATPVLPSSTENMEAVDSEETPHARGPAEIGVEDKGPQSESETSHEHNHGIEDLEEAMGRPGEGTAHRAGSAEGDAEPKDEDVRAEGAGKSEETNAKQGE